MTPEETAFLRRNRQRIKTKRVLLACVVLFAVGNFLIGPLMSAIRQINPLVAVVYAMIGSIGAQGGLHAIWCVFASAGLVRRLVLGTVVGLGLFGAYAMGLAVYIALQSFGSTSGWQDVVIELLCLPLMAIAIQSPLWIARCFFRWRVLHRRDPARRSAPESIGIRDILFATGAVAMALSAARVGLMVRYAPHDFSLLPLVIGALVAAAVSLLTTLPVVVATLRARRLWMVLPATLFLDLVVIIALAVTISAVEADRPPLWALLMMALIPISFFVCLDWGRR